MGKIRFTKLPTPVYRYTQKPILYHDIEYKFQYFDISIHITHHYVSVQVILNLDQILFVFFFNSFDPSHCAAGVLKGKNTLVFSPFGMGRRKCPGYLFSYVEVGTFLTILLQQFKFEPVGGAKEVEQVYGLVTNPKDKLYFYVHLTS